MTTTPPAASDEARRFKPFDDASVLDVHGLMLENRDGRLVVSGALELAADETSRRALADLLHALGAAQAHLEARAPLPETAPREPLAPARDVPNPFAG